MNVMIAIVMIHDFAALVPRTFGPFLVSNRIECASATMMLHLAKDIQYAVVESTLHLAKDIQYAVVDSPPRLY